MYLGTNVQSQEPPKGQTTNDSSTFSTDVSATISQLTFAIRNHTGETAADDVAGIVLAGLEVNAQTGPYLSVCLIVY